MAELLVELVEVVQDYVDRMDRISDPEMMRLRGEDWYAWEAKRERAHAVLARFHREVGHARRLKRARAVASSKVVVPGFPDPGDPLPH